MHSAHATADMRRAYQFYVGAAGSEARAAEVLGQAAYDVDDFKAVSYTHLSVPDLRRISTCRCTYSR